MNLTGFQRANLNRFVLKALKNLFSDEKIVNKLFEKAKISSNNNSKLKEITRLKSMIYGYESQLASLTERLAELPQGVPAKSIFDQMKETKNSRKK